MFWGLIMEPGKKYSQTVEKSFHVSQAALDLNTAGADNVQVLLGFENRHYLLCTLQKNRVIQTPLDLNFQVGDKVSFATNGQGHVHLTGYIVPEDDYFGEEEEDEDVEEEEEIPKLVPVSTNKKRKAPESNKEKPDKNKKSKTELLLNEAAETDDSDDSDVNLTDLLEGEEEAEEEEDNISADEVDEEDDGEDEDDVEEEEEEEEDDEEEELEVANEIEKNISKKETPKQNGVVNKKDKTPLINKKVKPSQGKVAEKTPKKEIQKVEKSPKVDKQQKSPGKIDGTPEKKTAEGGVIIEELLIGNGAVAKPGKTLQVYYEGRLKSNNKMFDSTTHGAGFKFRLGKQQVIKGWDVGVVGMKVGGRRRITCPPNMAYGAQGSPPVIPPNSTLVFEVELRNIK